MPIVQGSHVRPFLVATCQARFRPLSLHYSSQSCRTRHTHTSVPDRAIFESTVTLSFISWNPTPSQGFPCLYFTLGVRELPFLPSLRPFRHVLLDKQSLIQRLTQTKWKTTGQEQDGLPWWIRRRRLFGEASSSQWQLIEFLSGCGSMFPELPNAEATNTDLGKGSSPET